MFSVDYPFSSMGSGRQFLEVVRGAMSGEEMEGFAGGTAAKLLGLGGSES